eukprot:scaffold133041_cov31-Tisochrysis_lutea.AAC.3
MSNRAPSRRLRLSCARPENSSSPAVVRDHRRVFVVVEDHRVAPLIRYGTRREARGAAVSISEPKPRPPPWEGVEVGVFARWRREAEALRP